MNRDEKNQAVATLHDEIGSATNAFLIEFKGITVPQVTELRRQIREAKSNYVVVKNTLALIALKDSPMIELREQFSGPTAVAYGQDAVILAKTLTKFAKDVPALIFKGALLDGKVVAATEIDAIANLPTREELVSKLLFVLQTPIRNLVTVLSANQRNLAVVLDQIAKQRSASEPASDSGATESPSPSESPASAREEASVESAASPEPATPEASSAPVVSSDTPESVTSAESAVSPDAATPEASAAPVVSSSEAENSTPSESSESSENSTASESDSNQSEKEPIGG